jgi:hypothetical protein
MKLKQRFKAAAFAQFRHPTGFWGHGAGLDVRPHDRVLEIGGVAA